MKLFNLTDHFNCFPDARLHMPRSKLQHTSIEVNGQTIPVKVYHESRRGIRFSLGKRAAILRMPNHLAATEQKVQWQQFTKWVEKQIKARPGSENAYGKLYEDGDILRVGERQYLLKIETTENTTHSGKIEAGRIISLKLSNRSNEQQQKKATQHLLSRLVAQDFKPEITRRVMELNHLHFQKKVNSVNLKFNRSNWGSCSTKNNVNISTCLLFAPGDVVDYVIIHELAHLVEMNHSPRFWALVENAMPDYKEKEKWLKENWQKCIF